MDLILSALPYKNTKSEQIKPYQFANVLCKKWERLKFAEAKTHNTNCAATGPFIHLLDNCITDTPSKSKTQMLTRGMVSNSKSNNNKNLHTTGAQQTNMERSKLADNLSWKNTQRHKIKSESQN